MNPKLVLVGVYLILSPPKVPYFFISKEKFMAYWLTHLGKFLFFFSTFSGKKKNRVFFFSWKSLTSTDSRLKKNFNIKSVKGLCSRQFLRNTGGSIPQNFPFSHFWDFGAFFFFQKLFFFSLFFFSWKSL